MTTNEAIDLARNSFVKLGYKLADFHMDESPTKIEGSYENARLGHVPFCQLTWQSPDKGRSNFYYLEFHVDMNQRRLAGMNLVGKKLWRSLPKVDATPELETDYQKKHPLGKMYSRTNAQPTRP